MQSTDSSRETERLNALKRYHIMDSVAEQEYDDITSLAAFICETPIALITLLDESRQWFKSKLGLETSETAREVAFCNHAIMQSDIMIVNDALEDRRFVHNPLVTQDPKIRFYAGSQLVTSDGFNLGTLCVIDRKPRDLTAAQQTALKALARQVIAQMEFRHMAFLLEQSNKQQAETIAELEKAENRIKRLEGIISICSYCKKIREEDGNWQQLEIYIRDHSEADFSHGICSDCFETVAR